MSIVNLLPHAKCTSELHKRFSDVLCSERIGLRRQERELTEAQTPAELKAE